MRGRRGRGGDGANALVEFAGQGHGISYLMNVGPLSNIQRMVTAWPPGVCALVVALLLLAGVENALFAQEQDLAAGVHRIFERSCAQCHDRETAKRVRGGFGFVLDLDRLAADPGYVTRGDPEASDLYLVLIDPDQDVLMPPPDSDAPPLKQEEIETVGAWIRSLGKTEAPPVVETDPPDASAQSAETKPALAEVETSPNPARTMASPQVIFARGHILLVHFPIALLVLAAFIEWLGWGLKRSVAWWIAVRWMIAVAAICSVASGITGWTLAGVEGYRDATVFSHRWLGVAASVAAILAWGLLEMGHTFQRRRWLLPARLILAIAALLVSFAGHTGGELVHGEGFPFAP